MTDRIVASAPRRPSSYPLVLLLVVAPCACSPRQTVAPTPAPAASLASTPAPAPSLASTPAPSPAPAAPPAASLASTPLLIPGGAGGVGFDDLRYSSHLKRVIVPAGHTGKLDLI